jgi:hypothetical protein
MDLVPFHKLVPEIAEKETRVIIVFGGDDVPADTYGLLEYYCPDPGCDCRRVMINVVSKTHPERGFLASISYGFDRDDEMAGPFLDPLNFQSELAEALLVRVEVALLDSDYVARLERHYTIVKETAVAPTHRTQDISIPLKTKSPEPLPSSPKVYVGDYVFESLEDYFAAMRAWEEHREPFTAQAEALAAEFIDYLYQQGLSQRTVRKHSQNIDMFIVYLTQYTDTDDFATVRRGVVNTSFFRWYRRKVWDRTDPASLKSSTKKFFQFLADEKGIYNEKVLGKRKR